MRRGAARVWVLAASLGLLAAPFPLTAEAAPQATRKKPKATPRKRAPAKKRVAPAPSPIPTPSPRAASSDGSAALDGPTESDLARLGRIRARRAAVEREIRKLAAQTDSVLTELDAIDLDLQLAGHLLDEASLDYRQTSRRLDATLREVKSTRERLEVTRPRVIRSLLALNKLGELSYARLLFSLDDPADILRGYRYVSRIASADGEQIREFRADLLRLGALEEELKKRTAQALETRQKYAEAKRHLAARKASRESRIAEIMNRQQIQEELAGEYQKRETELVRILGESGALGGERPRRAAPASFPPFSGAVALDARKGDLPWPVKGSPVKRFGVERDPRFGTRTLQQGIEIEAGSDHEVRAVHPGRVVFADQFAGYGLLVIVDHGNREHTLYGRLGELRVAPGAEVGEGSLLGILPDTGLIGAGLHFEVRLQGRPEDPLNWLRQP